MATSQIQDIKTFKNPSGYWGHRGSFTVELTPDTDKSIVPSGVEILGDIVRVKSGRIQQKMGGIQFYYRGTPFGWGYTKVKVIRDGSGNLLWVNWNFT